ncbi:MAG: LysM peptidoglycan-binding domain-containing protein [Gammaproteobacteria bacterium]|nr:LysM peptidoglycan-binding domain-containing protein [Gammaproteobacteria bacterium]
MVAMIRRLPGRRFLPRRFALPRLQFRAMLLAAVTVTVASITVAWSPTAAAHHLLPQHHLQCSANFPCPPEIRPRVHFWIEVFRSWGQGVAVLHDPARPERVYAVVDTGHGCNRPARAQIKRERERVRQSLRQVAGKIEAGHEITSTGERHLAALFPANGAREIRAAARDIRCQSGVRDSFLRGLAGYEKHRPMVSRILAENGLPAEIRYLPFVESSYNPAAYSKAGAAGIWQIMPKTARHLGLELSATLDERLDPEAATRAAAAYLKRADSALTAVARETRPGIGRAQLNPFIITSYNYGVTGMKRAMRKVGPDFMRVLDRYKSPRFQIAVKNFYASFLAARHVARNADAYFGARSVATAAAAREQTVLLRHAVSIDTVTSVFGLREAELRPLNRALTRFVWRGWRLLPAGYRLRLPARADNWDAARAKLNALGPERVLAGGNRYTVQRGDTACGIARALSVNCSALMRLNNLGGEAVILVGQQLLIPGRPAALAGERRYRVRRGDTACIIAKLHAVNCRDLIGFNRLGRTALIHPGQILSIPPGGSRYRDDRGLNADNQYLVRRGDSACGIAARFAVRCEALRALNGLDRAAVIHPGQKLKIPGLVVPDTSETAQQLAQVDVGSVGVAAAAAAAPKTRAAPAVDAAADNTVDAADSATESTVAVDATLAESHAAEVDATVAESNVAEAPVVAIAETAAAEFIHANEVDVNAAGEAVSLIPLPAAQAAAANQLRNLLDTLPDLGIRVADADGAPVYSIRVEAEETLGHFADWLGIGGASRLRDLNRLRHGRPIVIGQRLRLPVENARMAQRFEQRRTDYHQVLSESLKEHYNLVGVETYTVKKGDSPWTLSIRLGFPVWLLYRLNPALHNAPLKPGQPLMLPKLNKRS